MLLRDSPSKNLQQFGQAQIMVQLFHGLFAAIYCVWAAVAPGHVMDPAIYGDVVTSVKAEVWSYSILTVVLVYFLGILINGAWRWSPWIRLSSALLQTCQIGFFAVMAYRPDSLDPFIAGCAVLLTLNLWCVWLNAGDVLRAIRMPSNAHE